MMLEVIKELLDAEDKQEMEATMVASNFDGIKALLSTLDEAKNTTYNEEEIDDYLRYKIMYQNEDHDENFFIGFDTRIRMNMAIAIIYNMSKGLRETIKQRESNTTYTDILNQIVEECADYYGISSGFGARSYPAIFVKFILEHL